jgi:hypothetical protein
MFQEDYRIVVTLAAERFTQVPESALGSVAQDFSGALSEVIREVALLTHALGHAVDGHAVTEEDLRLSVVSVRRGSLEMILEPVRAIAESAATNQILAGLIINVITAGLTAVWNIVRGKKAADAHQPPPQNLPVAVPGAPYPADVSDHLPWERHERLTTFFPDGRITIREVRTRRWV